MIRNNVFIKGMRSGTVRQRAGNVSQTINGDTATMNNGFVSVKIHHDEVWINGHAIPKELYTDSGPVTP